MKSVLIVEDEGAIRTGLIAMVKKAPIVVENVIECKNGLDALEILQNQIIDVMITDIRMPKMDGIELVRAAQELPSPPITIVISGYSDFDYAVNVFRQGVRDYLLKPIERDCLYKLLVSLQMELDEKALETCKRLEMSKHLIQSIILGIVGDSDSLDTISVQLGSFFSGDYYVICCSQNQHPEIEAYHFCEKIHGQTVLIVSDATYAEISNSKVLKEGSAGISAKKSGIRFLHEAYAESLQARIHAFVFGGVRNFPDLPERQQQENHQALITSADQITAMLGAGKKEEATNLLGQMLLYTQNHRISADSFIELIEQLLKKLRYTFSGLTHAMEELEKLSGILAFDSAFDYYNVLCDWMNRISDHLYAENENKSVLKIHTAIDYISLHYRTPINMAVVSNYISMNYTQFSSLFKQFTSKNFSDYLRDLRLMESKRLLCESSFSIRKVGEMSGFKNEKHFMKCFKQEIGISPSEYRRTAQKKLV